MTTKSAGDVKVSGFFCIFAKTSVMKRILAFILGLVFTVQAFGQNVNTIKFLGIPVDGRKSEVIQELKKKGFTYNSTDDYLTGKFNGTDSNVRISENYGKVDRIFVADADTRSEAQIRIRFNHLLSQFRENEKYIELDDNEEIRQNENISYEMTVHAKEYAASFYVNPMYGWTEDEKEMLVESVASEVKARANAGQFGEITNEQYLALVKDALLVKVFHMIGGQVWFKISEYHGGYYICIYYDNLKNRPNGEDL